MSSTGNVVLAPLGALYRAVIAARRSLYKSGKLQVHKLEAPVISVGNITTGGTGKTPLVEWLARAIAKEGKRVCILTRGYGRKSPRERVLVSDGDKVLADPAQGGDEPVVLAEALVGIAAVVSDADRVGAATWARQHLQSEVFILDDGFQHWRIARDLDLVALDATNPWGGGKLLPHGRLREPVRELARADCIVVTRSEMVDDADELCAEAKRLSLGRPVVKSRTATKGLRALEATNSQASQTVELSGPIAAFCALGNPSSFFTHLTREGYQLAWTRAFPDHHVYSQRDVLSVIRRAKQAGARTLMTTAKDAVKLRLFDFELPCFVLEISLEVDNEELLLELVRGVIGDLRPGRL